MSSKQDMCPTCDGRGKVRQHGFDGWDFISCGACDGTGRLVAEYSRQALTAIASVLARHRPVLTAALLELLDRCPDLPRLRFFVSQSDEQSIRWAWEMTDATLRQREAKRFADTSAAAD